MPDVTCLDGRLPPEPRMADSDLPPYPITVVPTTVSPSVILRLWGGDALWDAIREYDSEKHAAERCHGEHRRGHVPRPDAG